MYVGIYSWKIMIIYTIFRIFAGKNYTRYTLQRGVAPVMYSFSTSAVAVIVSPKRIDEKCSFHRVVFRSRAPCTCIIYYNNIIYIILLCCRHALLLVSRCVVIFCNNNIKYYTYMSARVYMCTTQTRRRYNNNHKKAHVLL